MSDILHLVKFHVPADKAYQAITTSEGLRNWWSRDATIEPEIEGKGEIGFYGRRFIAQLIVEALKPNALVRWDVTNAARTGKHIEFNLKTEGNDTTLRFAHRGFKSDNEEYASATTRWGFYLISLKRYLETGKGSPNPEDGEAFG